MKTQDKNNSKVLVLPSATFQFNAQNTFLCILCGHKVKALPACRNKSTAVTAGLGKKTLEQEKLCRRSP